MTGLGLRSGKGKKLCLNSFMGMLRNQFYTGVMKSKKWGSVKGLHAPLVDERVFHDVQSILKGKKPVAAPYVLNREDFPLRRFLRCSKCDHPLTGGPSRSKTGKLYDYYRCCNTKCRAISSLAANKATAEFLELVGRLRADASFTSEFFATLKEEWANKEGNSALVVPRLQARLKEREEVQEKLLEARLMGDKAIMPHFDRLNGKYEAEIAAIREQIAEADLAKATFADLLEFSKSMLVNIGQAWAKANVDQKQRVQNVLFPGGLKYHAQKGILNPDNDCLFSQLEAFLGGKMNMVRPERFELPTLWFEAKCSIQLSYGRTPRNNPSAKTHLTISLPCLRHRRLNRSRRRDVFGPSNHGDGLNDVQPRATQQPMNDGTSQATSVILDPHRLRGLTEFHPPHTVNVTNL